MDPLSVRINLQDKVTLVVLAIVLGVGLVAVVWPVTGWVGRTIAMAIGTGFGFWRWREVQATTTLDPVARTITISRFMRSYLFGFDDIAEVFVPRKHEVRLIMKKDADVPRLLTLHGRRIPITLIPRGDVETVTRVAALLDVPVRGVDKYRTEQALHP